MKTSKQIRGFNQTLIALAVLAAFAPARAQDIGELTAPGNSVSVGVGVASGDEKDRARFGIYNGLRRHDVNGLLGFSLVDRDSDSGKWFTLEGSNLGLDNRELSFSYRRLGDLKLWGEYSELVRHDPRTVNTAMRGVGTTTPTAIALASPGTGSEHNFELKRKGFSLNAEKWFGGTLQLEVNFKNEEKHGTRLFGIGFGCNAVSAPGCVAPTFPAIAPVGTQIFIMPEPVNSTIRQLDAKFNFSGERLKLSGGYYGSFYTNANGNITPAYSGTMVNAVGAPTTVDGVLATNLLLPIALWPDNQSHQVYVGGNYTITPTTRVNFKYSYTHATQDDNFLGMGLAGAPAGRAGLGGEINTTRAQVGFSAHPLHDLRVRGDAKYEEKKNKTPIAYYNIEGVNTFTNGNPSPKKWDAKLEANYRLPANYGLTGTVFYESEDYGTFTPTDSVAGLSGMRQKMEETGYRLEVRKSMSETLTGWLSYSSASREGNSSWLKPRSLPLTGLFEASDGCQSATVAGVPNACIYNRTGIFPYMFMDRDRDKWKLMANWEPVNRLSLSFFVEDGRDKYTGPTEHGLRDTGMQMYAIDASYALSEAWKATAYWSRGKQTVHAGHSTGYDAALRDTADSFGLGIVGKPFARFQMGANLTYLNDVLKYQQDYDPLASAVNKLFLTEQGGLPDVTYRVIQLKLFGEYAVDKSSYVRVDLIHHRTKFNEWTYNFNGVPFFYSDNTTLNAQQNQNVTFLGVSYVYRFR